jgi:hypothetical protein
VIYRCSEERFLSQFEKDAERHLDWIEQHSGVGRATAPEIYQSFRESFRDSYGGPWRYNQAIGWLRLHGARSWIRADVWLCDGSRFLRRMRHKHFHYRGTEIVMKCPPSLSSSEIFERLRQQLENYQRAWRGRGFVLDLECFLDIGPFVNWRRAVDQQRLEGRMPVEVIRFRGTPLVIQE